MIKHFISVDIVDHRLVGMPHVLRVSGRPAARPATPRAIRPLRGIGLAAVLSTMLWAALLAAVTGPSDDATTRRVDTAACAGPAGTACETSPQG